MKTEDILKLEDLLKLIDAGFTKDEIIKLDTEPEPQKAKPQKAEPEPQKAEPEPQKAEPEPQKAEPEQQKAEPQTDTLKFIAEQFEKMTKAIQESNIINSDTKLKNDNKSAEQTLADIIAPPERKRGKN